MGVAKIDGLQALANVIAGAVPALAGKITVQQAVDATNAAWPNLAIIAPRLQFEPYQRAMRDDLGGGRVVFQYGYDEGPIQLRLETATVRERATLEDAITALARQDHPGVIVVPLAGTTYGTWAAAFELEDVQWRDERAQERIYESIITLNAEIPALAIISPVPQIDRLVLGITEDMVTAYDATTFATKPPPAGVELALVNADGSISPYNLNP